MRGSIILNQKHRAHRHLPRARKGRSTARARQREDESGLGSLHGGLAREARGPGSYTSTRAVGCGLMTQARSFSSRSNEVFTSKASG